MTTEGAPPSADAAAEIARLLHRIELLELSRETLIEQQGLRDLQARIETVEAGIAVTAREHARHVSRLQARITELEAQLAATLGTVARPTPDEPATITHDIPPSAPR